MAALIGCFHGSCTDRPLEVGPPPAGASIELNRRSALIDGSGLYATAWLTLHGTVIGAYLDDEEPDQQGKVLALRHAGYRGDILAGRYWQQFQPTPKLHHALNALEYYPQWFGETPEQLPPPAGWPAYIILWTSTPVSHESREHALRAVLAHQPKYVLLY